MWLCDLSLVYWYSEKLTNANIVHTACHWVVQKPEGLKPEA